MLRHMSFYRRVTIPLGAVLLGLWLGCFLPVLPLSAAQLWEEEKGTATGAQPVQPVFVELAKQLKPAKRRESGSRSIAFRGGGERPVPGIF